jgi:hypothetical protein
MKGHIIMFVVVLLAVIAGVTIQKNIKALNKA